MEREEIDEESLSEPYEAGSSSDDKVDKMSMMVQGLLPGMKQERDARKNAVLDMGKMVDRILPYREGADISQLLLALEAELHDIGVRKEDFWHILISKLPPKTKENVLDLLCEKGCTYDKLKSKLLDKMGLSQREVEVKLFIDWEEDTRNMDRVDRYRRVKSLVDRFVINAKDKTEVALFLMKAIYRIGLPITEQELMDSRPISTLSDLHDVATTLKTTNVKSRDQVRTEERREVWAAVF